MLNQGSPPSGRNDPHGRLGPQGQPEAPSPRSEEEQEPAQDEHSDEEDGGDHDRHDLHGPAVLVSVEEHDGDPTSAPWRRVVSGPSEAGTCRQHHRARRLSAARDGQGAEMYIGIGTLVAVIIIVILLMILF
jgi:hypothetical protein